MNREVSILAEDSRVLLSKVLRLKVESQERESDEPDMAGTSVALKLGYLPDSDKLMVEIVNVQNITPRVNRTSSRIQVYARLSPDSTGASEIVEHSTVFKDVGRSIIFELLGDPLRFQFNISHLTSRNNSEDGFLIIDLFHVNQAHLKLFAGESVVQVG